MYIEQLEETMPPSALAMVTTVKAVSFYGGLFTALQLYSALEVAKLNSLNFN